VGEHNQTGQEMEMQTVGCDPASCGSTVRREYMNWYTTVLVTIFGIFGIAFILSAPYLEKPIDPACRDIEAKYQALIKSEGSDAQPVITTKAQDDD